MYKRSDNIIYDKIFSSFDTAERPCNIFCERTSTAKNILHTTATIIFWHQ